MLLPPPISPLFPYTTLFRSRGHRVLPQPVHHVLELPADDRTGRLLRRPRRGRPVAAAQGQGHRLHLVDRKSTRLNSSHVAISYAVFCLKKKKETTQRQNHEH